MSGRSRIAFLLLVIAQGCHSIEEYVTRLYDVLPPARFVSGLFFADRRVGFLIFNISLVVFGFLCLLGPIRRGTPSAPALAWLWAVMELLNGSAHFVWAAFAGAYRPGLATAPLLVAIAAILVRQLLRSESTGDGTDDRGPSRPPATPRPGAIHEKAPWPRRTITEMSKPAPGFRVGHAGRPPSA